jgi:putative ABC transport system permease protein
MTLAALVAGAGCAMVRALVALHPRDFRQSFGDTVISETEADITAAVASGTLTTVSTAAGAVADATRGVLLERAAQLSDLRRNMLNALLADIRQAARTLRRDPAFTAVALSTLSAGLAMCVVVGVLVEAYLWRGLPYPEAHRLYDFQFVTPAITYPTGMDKADWGSLDDVIDVSISWDLDGFSLRGGAFPEVVEGTWVTPGYMEGFAVRPAIGRGFQPGDFDTGRPNVALISHRLWQTRFNADPAIIGRTFEAYVSDRPNEAEAFHIVGVLGPGHWHLNRFTEILAPLRAPSHPYIVRLREGVSPSVVAERITALVRAGATSVPEGWRAELRSTHGSYVERIRPLLMSVASATGLVLLIACANVSVLLTVRATRRQRENAVRQALGASSAQVTRATVAEPLILGGTAVALGLALAWGTLAVIAPLIGRYLGQQVPGGVTSLRIEPAAVAVTMGIGVLVVLICAIVPTWVARRTPAGLAVSGGQKGATDGRSTQRARGALIVIEVAACLTLLAGAGLTIQSAIRILRVDMGLDAENVVVGRFGLRARGYPDAAARLAFHERVLARASEVTHVEGIAFTNSWPLQQSMMRDVGSGAAAAPYQTRAGVVGVSPDYFNVLRISIYAGRALAPSDRIGSERVAMVSRTLAGRLWPDVSPIGQTLRVAPAPGSAPSTPASAFVVVGVTGDIRHSHTDNDLADVYLPFLQSPMAGAFAYLRVSGNAAEAERAFQRLLVSIDTDVAFESTRPLIDILDLQRTGARLLASVLVVFAMFAAALALVGIYGVIAYTVKQREREIAVRMAIGADRQTITRLFLRQGVALLGTGLLLGIAGGVVLGRLLGSQLFDVPPADPFVIAGATLAFAVCGIVAIAWPARTAASLDPAAILKE